MDRLFAIALCLAATLLPGTAGAVVCYTLYDRADNVIYRDTLPPVDMSVEGDAQRDALRRQGDYLLFVDTDSCPPVEFKFGEAGSRTLSVDNIIGGLRPMVVRPSRSSRR